MNTLNALVRPLICAAALTATSHSALSAGIPGQGTWETTLQARDINQDGVVDAYYDSALNITWLANWNANGAQSWDTAVAWASGLNLYGVVGWRLPSITDTGPPGCDYSNPPDGGTDCGFNPDTSNSEMAHMYYVTLGNKSPPNAGAGLTNTADFNDMQSSAYWSGTEYALDSSAAWYIYLPFGAQQRADKSGLESAVAVLDGDVTAVAEPQALAMMLAGLAGVGLVLRRRRHA